MAKKAAKAGGSTEVGDVLGLGKSVDAASSIAREQIRASADIRIKAMGVEEVRWTQRETTKRKNIQASVDKTKIIEDNKYKRAKTFNELGYRYINESDEILTATDNWYHYREKRVGNGITKTKLSALNTTFLVACFGPMFASMAPSGVDVYSSINWCQRVYENQVDKMEFMARTSSANNLTFMDQSGYDQAGDTDNAGVDESGLPTPDPGPYAHMSVEELKDLLKSMLWSGDYDKEKIKDIFEEMKGREKEEEEEEETESTTPPPLPPPPKPPQPPPPEGPEEDEERKYPYSGLSDAELKEMIETAMKKVDMENKRRLIGKPGMTDAEYEWWQNMLAKLLEELDRRKKG